MDSNAEMTEIVCLCCGERYADWKQASFDALSIAVCPHCGYDPANDWLLYENGVDLPFDDEEDQALR